MPADEEDDDDLIILQSDVLPHQLLEQQQYGPTPQSAPGKSLAISKTKSVPLRQEQQLRKSHADSPKKTKRVITRTGKVGYREDANAVRARQLRYRERRALGLTKKQESWTDKYGFQRHRLIPCSDNPKSKSATARKGSVGRTLHPVTTQKVSARATLNSRQPVESHSRLPSVPLTEEDGLIPCPLYRDCSSIQPTVRSTCKESKRVDTLPGPASDRHSPVSPAVYPDTQTAEGSEARLECLTPPSSSSSHKPVVPALTPKAQAAGQEKQSIGETPPPAVSPQYSSVTQNVGRGSELFGGSMQRTFNLHSPMSPQDVLHNQIAIEGDATRERPIEARSPSQSPGPSVELLETENRRDVINKAATQSSPDQESSPRPVATPTQAKDDEAGVVQLLLGTRLFMIPQKPQDLVQEVGLHRPSLETQRASKRRRTEPSGWSMHKRSAAEDFERQQTIIRCRPTSQRVLANNHDGQRIGWIPVGNDIVDQAGMRFTMTHAFELVVPSKSIVHKSLPAASHERALEDNRSTQRRNAQLDEPDVAMVNTDAGEIGPTPRPPNSKSVKARRPCHPPMGVLPKTAMERMTRQIADQKGRQRLQSLPPEHGHAPKTMINLGHDDTGLAQYDEDLLIAKMRRATSFGRNGTAEASIAPLMISEMTDLAPTNMARFQRLTRRTVSAPHRTSDDFPPGAMADCVSS